MKKLPSAVPFSLILLSVLLFQDCATLTRRPKQRIPVTSSPAGAAVLVNGIQQGVTPITLRLARKDKGQVIRIEYPGYNPLEVRMGRDFSAVHGLGDALVGGIAGLFVGWKIDYSNDGNGGLLLPGILAGIGAFFLADLATGAGNSHHPSDLIVTLSKADGTPRVDTMLVDAEESRNIKWIRVHRD